MVSASMLPITNAPKALLKPTWVETTAMRQHSPSATTSSVSSVMSFLTLRRNMGKTEMPTTNHSMRKKAIRMTLPSISPPSGLLPCATDDSITIMTMARMSSSMSTLMTSPANCCCRSPISSNALYIIVVDDMASIPARKRQFIWLQPNAFPTVMPSSIMQKMMVMAAITGAAPILSIFLKEKSRPREKSRNMTPMSAHVCTLALSITDMVYGMCGLTTNPATIYPSTSGCFSRLKSIVTTPATTSMRARSLTNVGISDISILLMCYLIPLYSIAIAASLVILQCVGKRGGVASEREVIACIWCEHHRARHVEAVEVASERGGGH